MEAPSSSAPPPDDISPIPVFIAFKAPNGRSFELSMLPDERDRLVADFCSNVSFGSYRYGDEERIALRFEDVLYIS